jgi:glycosyltransferase involved in cell wall biosynthesis
VRSEIIYIGSFKPPDRNAAAFRVRGAADALSAAGYTVTLMGDEYTGVAGTNQVVSRFQRLSIAAKRGFDYLVTSSAYSARIASIDWQHIAAVIYYPGSAALLWRLLRSCRKHGVPLIVDSGEWYDPSHTLGGRFGPFAMDSELRMRWLHLRAGNMICDSPFLAKYYASKGCNAIRVPTLVGKDFGQYCTDLTTTPGPPLRPLALVYAGSPGKKELFPEILAGIHAARSRGIDVTFRVVGITKEQLSAIVKGSANQAPNLDGVTCYGRLPREVTLKIVADSHFTVILRPQARFANAGFPAKFVESFALGVPVMANSTSDIAAYLRDGRDGYLLRDATAGALEEAIVRASQLTIEERSQMRQQARLRAHECFDYRRYTGVLADFVSKARLCG